MLTWYEITHTYTLLRFVDRIECRKWLISIQSHLKHRLTHTYTYESDDKWRKIRIHTNAIIIHIQTQKKGEKNPTKMDFVSGNHQSGEQFFGVIKRVMFLTCTYPNHIRKYQQHKQSSEEGKKQHSISSYGVCVFST